MIRKAIKRLKRAFSVRPPVGGPVSVRVGNFDLCLPRDHPLPSFQRQHPTYCWNLPRIAALVQRKYPDLMMIDVGANVGDTVALCRSTASYPILCFEGDSHYFELLTQNLKHFPQTYAHQLFLGDANASIPASVEMARGTGRIVYANARAEGSKIKIATLDAFLEDHPAFRAAKLLKIDTDGYDLRILRGAMKYIQEAKPVLFFEYDRVFLDAVGDNGLEMFGRLAENGYEPALFYDNRGRLILSTSVQNRPLITQLDNYIRGRKSAFPYYDICVLHGNDDVLASEMVRSEMEL